MTYVGTMQEKGFETRLLQSQTGRAEGVLTEVGGLGDDWQESESGEGDLGLRGAS